MVCPNCSGSDINIQMVQTSAKTRKRNMGCLWELGRLILICCTCGLWLLIGKRSGTSNTKIKNDKIAICQKCGNSWKVK